jgi:hypothetical protein
LTQAPKGASKREGGSIDGSFRQNPALSEALGPDVDAVAKELEVNAGPSIGEGYSVETEVQGISHKAEEAGFDRFHLHSHPLCGHRLLSSEFRSADKIHACVTPFARFPGNCDPAAFSLH